MEYLVLFTSILTFLFTIIILAPFGKISDKKRARLDRISGHVEEEVDEELSKPFFDRFVLPIFYDILRAVSKVFPKNQKAQSVKGLETDLKLAGINLSVGEFSAIRVILMVVLIGFSLIPMTIETIDSGIKFLILLIGVIASVLIPRYYLKSAITKRQESIRNDLPDVLDLLSVSVEAGLGFDSAIIRVTKQSEGPLSDELKKVYREIQLGRPRREALKELSQRSNIDELKVFVSSVIQADQLGISVKNVLRTQATQLRVTRKQRAEEKALKAPVKMMIPLVVFIFPVLFIILLGPSVLELAGLMGG